MFALGHGLFITSLAIGVGHVLARAMEPYAPWFLIAMGLMNFYRLWRPRASSSHSFSRMPTTSPLLLGILFGASFETASQLSALVLSADVNPWFFGGVFSGGMILVDGIDGYLASATRRNASNGNPRAKRAGQILGIFVNLYSLGFGTVELLKINLERASLPLGVFLFLVLIGLRVWGTATASTARAQACATETHEAVPTDVRLPWNEPPIPAKIDTD